MQAGSAFAQRSKIDPHIGTHPSMGAVAARLRLTAEVANINLLPEVNPE